MARSVPLRGSRRRSPVAQFLVVRPQAHPMFNRIKSIFGKDKPQPVEFHDAEFGVLTAEVDLWSGIARRDGLAIPFTVAGTLTAPDSRLLDRVRSIAGSFQAVESEGLAFLRAEIPEVRSRKLTFHHLEFLWEDKPDIYSLEWLADPDDFCFWRVNYEAGKPKEAGFDD